MKPIRKKWELPPEPDESVFRNLASLPKPIVRALYHRGISDADAARIFFASDAIPLADPFLFADMSKAVERILRAVRSGEPIVVYGDYDTDGVTATAMLVDFLGSIDADVSAYIPSRFEEGYGLNRPALEGLAAQGAKVVVTVDCGARSVEEAAFARDTRLDLIITDHHAPGAEEPPAYAFLNPKRSGCIYPEKNLAGVGVAFRLVQALIQRMGETERMPSERYLDLVALGTVADIVPLTGENRVLVQGGLNALNDPEHFPLRPGLRRLLEVAGLTRGKINAQAIGFVLGPRLNASGRLDTADTSLNLLLARDPAEADTLALRLESQNRERQSLTRSTVLAARNLNAQAADWDPDSPPFFIMVGKEGFHAGIIGLAASKLMEEYYRPVAVVTIEGDKARGSVRSVPGFHITEALDSCRDLLDRYGGHAAAAGFSLAASRLPELRERLAGLAGEALRGRSLRPVLPVDSEVRISDLTWDLHGWITRLEPCGQGNPAPVFFTRGAHIRAKRCVGKDSSHLKLTLSDGRANIDAIAFGFGHLEKSLSETVDVAFSLEENDYYGKQMQMRVIDMQGDIGVR
ncbi:MAG: single-stranded-DNA-specific exonuclease RecJ [Anaerolineales bacterium]|nr:single-stranded-DNA-specific exonuclease RecJ [Anaerolineales bacterium]